MGRRPPIALFLDEAEIARRLGQDASAWRGKVVILERDGFPRVDPIMEGRYWPAVVAYWNRRYGLGSISPSAMDGMENLDAL